MPCWRFQALYKISEPFTIYHLTVTMESIGNHHRSFEWYLPFHPKGGGSICPQDTRMAISPQRVIWSTSCLVLGYGFWDRRMEWRYFQFISDSLRPSLSENGGPDMTWHDRRYRQEFFWIMTLWAERCRLLPNYFVGNRQRSALCFCCL